MKTYKVIALSVGGLGKKIFNSGDEVNENNFIAGRAEQLVDQGFLKRLGENSEKANESSETETEFIPKVENASSTKEEVVPPVDGSFSEEEQAIYDGMTRNEIMAELGIAGIDFSKNSSKEVLYKIWKAEKDRLDSEK